MQSPVFPAMEVGFSAPLPCCTCNQIARPCRVIKVVQMTLFFPAIGNNLMRARTVENRTDESTGMFSPALLSTVMSFVLLWWGGTGCGVRSFNYQLKERECQNRKSITQTDTKVSLHKVAFSKRYIRKLRQTFNCSFHTYNESNKTKTKVNLFYVLKSCKKNKRRKRNEDNVEIKIHEHLNRLDLLHSLHSVEIRPPPLKRHTIYGPPLSYGSCSPLGDSPPPSSGTDHVNPKEIQQDPVAYSCEKRDTSQT